MPAKVINMKTGMQLDVGCSDGYILLEHIVSLTGSFSDVVIEDANFKDFGLIEDEIKHLRFVNCTFQNVNLAMVKRMEDIIFDNCSIVGIDSWIKNKGVIILDNCKVNIPPSNEEIQKFTGGKVFSLPNKDYVKVQVECDFCHNTFYEVMSRKKPYKMLKEVPNCDKHVCEQCYKNYDLGSKRMGYRTYGWRGPLSFYRTPMDAKNTEILGLEMEFEGDFYDWKSLQDAHRGHLHYGYDTSVVGQNELSWDCGSYSYWKYLAPLEDVCKAVENGGGHAGPSAGIHIHVSTPDTNIINVTRKINRLCQKDLFKILMECVSLRRDKAKFLTYANLLTDIDEHHAGISYNGHGTCEFRVFNSTLNPRIILRHLKFCKEFYHMVKTKGPDDNILQGFSKETKKHIAACAKAQAEAEFVSLENANKLIKALGV